MEYVKWFHYLLYKFKRHSKLHLNSRTIKNFLTLASRYLQQFCNFYPQLSLQTIFSALKLTKICCININISFLEFNHKLVPPLLLTYQTWKYSHDLTRYESGIQTFQLFLWIERNLEVQAKPTFNNQYFIYFMNWKRLRSPTRATLTNAKFQFPFSELGKKSELILKHTIRNPNFESKYELQNTMSQFQFYWWK